MMIISVNVPGNLNDWHRVPVLGLSYSSWASNKDHFCCFVVQRLVFLLTVFRQGFWTWGSGFPPRCPYSTASEEMQGVCPAELGTRGRAGHPTGIYTHP